MDTSNKNNVPSSQGEAATFGEYAATSSTNSAKTQIKDANQSNVAAVGQSGYQKTSNEIRYGGDFSNATSGAARSGDNHTSSNVNGYGTYIGSSADILQASSAAGGEGAQFGEYKATNKVNGVESTNANHSNGNTKITQVTTTTVKKTTTPATGQTFDTGYLLGDHNTGDTTTKFNFEGFDFGSTDEAFQSETGVTLGNLKTTKTKRNLGFEQFGSSVDHLQSMDNKGSSGDTKIKTDFDLDAYLRNDNLKTFEQNNDNISNVNLAGFTTDIPGFDIKPTVTTTTVTKTTSTTNKPSDLPKLGTAVYTTSSPIIESIPISTSNLKVDPKIETIYKEQDPSSGLNLVNWQIPQTNEAATIKKEEVKNVITTTTTEKVEPLPIILNAPKPLPTSNQIIEKTTITTSTPVIETATYLQPPVQIKQEPSKVVDTGVTLKNLNIPVFDKNVMYQQNQSRGNIINIDEYLTPSIPTVPVTISEPKVKLEKYTQTSPVIISAPETITSVPTTVTRTKVTTNNLGNDMLFGDYKTSSNIPPIDFDISKLGNIPPVQTTITPTPTTVTTQNLGDEALFGEYKTTTNIDGVQTQYMPQIDAIPTTFTQNITVPSQINIVPPPPAPITIHQQQPITVQVPKIQKVVVPKVKQVYVPSNKKIYVRKPPGTGSIAVPTTASYSQKTFVTPAVQVPAIPSPVPAVQMIERSPLPPTIGSSIVTVKPPVVPVAPRNSLLLAKAPGNSILTPQPGLPYAQGSVRVAQPALPYAQGSVRVAQPALPYAQGSVRVAQPALPYAQGSVRVAQPALPYAQGSVRVAQPALPYAQGSVRVAQPSLPIAQGSVRVPQPGLPYAQGSIPVANIAQSTIPGQTVPQILPKSPLPVPNQPIMTGAVSPINPMMNANYLTPGLGMNRPNVYNASTYRTNLNNLGRNASKYRNLNRNNMMGNMSNTGQYTTRTYNARRL